MRREERIATLRRGIFRWFGRHRRDLPWRRTRDPWRVLVSEVMLQQTQVPRVVPKYLAFTRRWPTPAALAKAPLSDVLRAWSGLGYNRRGRNLWLAAKAIVDRFDGRVPTAIDELETLPGIGRYTARAVAAFAFNRGAALWDTNIRRIFSRYFAGGEFGAPVSDRALDVLLAAALPAGKSRDWHGALMDFGSAVCIGRDPDCAACPLRRSCRAAPHFLAEREPRRALLRKQPAFKGSWRQGRGAILKLLAGDPTGRIPSAALAVRTGRDDADALAAELVDEGLLVRHGRDVCLP